MCLSPGTGGGIGGQEPPGPAPLPRPRPPSARLPASERGVLGAAGGGGRPRLTGPPSQRPAVGLPGCGRLEWPLGRESAGWGGGEALRLHPGRAPGARFTPAPGGAGPQPRGVQGPGEVDGQQGPELCPGFQTPLVPRGARPPLVARSDSPGMNEPSARSLAPGAPELLYSNQEPRQLAPRRRRNPRVWSRVVNLTG